MKKSIAFLLLFLSTSVMAQQVPVMETGGQPMPDEWIDKDTGHRPALDYLPSQFRGRGECICRGIVAIKPNPKSHKPSFK